MDLRIVRDDITTLAADAIVNAANPGLLSGGGVDGAIHRAAGPHLLAACRALPESAPGVRCPTGEARLTPGFDLPARYVIHTVGPVWHGGCSGEAELLAACHSHCLRLAQAHDLRHVVFPAISCGVYGYPPAQAAAVAIAALQRERTASDASLRVTICCFNATVEQAFRAALAHTQT